MIEETKLPSAADRDAVNAELQAQANTQINKAFDDASRAMAGGPRPLQSQTIADVPATLGGESQKIIVSRHGEVFSPEIHAALPNGEPKTDSTGRFILKVHDYVGPRASAQFPQ